MDAPRVDDPMLGSVRLALDTLLTRELVQHAELDATVAETIATAVLQHSESGARDRSSSEEDHYLSPSTMVLRWWQHEASAALTCARATGRCPGGSSWWMDDGIPVLAFLIEGEANYAAIEQAEILAGPYDRAVDFNWPDSIVAERLPDLVTGTSFVAGDGEGNRARYDVVRWEGRLVARMQAHSWINHTDDIRSAALDELTAIVGLDEAFVRDCVRWFHAQGFSLILEPAEDGWSTRVLDGSGRPVAVSQRARQRWLAAEFTAVQFRWRDKGDEEGG